MRRSDSAVLGALILALVSCGGEAPQRKQTKLLAPRPAAPDREVPASIDPAPVREEAPPAPRLAGYDTCVTIARGQAWGTDIRQIPATVIDRGVMRHVPYLSYKAGDHEVNVYGDPEAPAGVEVGMYGRLVGNDEARQECIDYLAGVLGLAKDRATLRELTLDKDVRDLDGLTFEITPATAEDAYGGWWASVYDETALDAARASDAEVETLAEKKETIRVVTNADLLKPRTAERGEVPAWMKANEGQSYNPAWSANDLPAARNTGDRVWVKGYHRKNGTYVRGYSRRK